MKSGSSTVLWQPANFDTHPSCGRSSKGSDFVAAGSGMVMVIVILIMIMMMIMMMVTLKSSKEELDLVATIIGVGWCSSR